MTAWTTPRTWVTSEQVTASLLNVQIRDNLNSLLEDIPQTPNDNPQGMAAPSVTSSTIQVANCCHYFRLFAGAFNTTARKVRMHINASSGTVGCAIYTNSGSGITSVPGTRAATTGSIACPAGGQASIDLGTTITGIYQGTHWFAFSASSIAMTFVGIGVPVATSHQGGIAAAQTTAHPPPSPAVPTASNFVMPQIVLMPT